MVAGACGLVQTAPMTDPVQRVFRFSSPAETRAFAEHLAPSLRPGDTILLAGGLGAGKSHFARSVIQARLADAGLTEDVPSPTFTLVQTYHDRRCEIWHADLYRLNDVTEMFELGLQEAFETAICLVEWPDRLDDLAPAGALTLTFEMTDQSGERIATASYASGRWQRVLEWVNA